MGPVSTLGLLFLFFLELFGDAAQLGPKAPGGLTLTRAIGQQDTKPLNKLTSDPGGAGIFSSIGLTSCQLEELGRFNFNSMASRQNRPSQSTEWKKSRCQRWISCVR